MRTNVWLSVDWDYFCREDPSWDFAHAELPDYNDLLWGMRAHQFSEMGLDLMDEMSLRHSSPHPATFWLKLRELGYSFGNVKAVVVADSHQWAHKMFRRASLEGPSLQDTRLVNFDAHHDLTYDISRFEQEVVDERVTCENWLLMSHISQIGLKSLIVYPEWKGLREWDKSFTRYPELDRAVRLYTKPCVWPSSDVKDAAGDVELVYLCRSSAWSPPWHDQAFLDFAYDLQQLTQVPLATPFTALEGIDPLAVRTLQLEPPVMTREAENQYLAQLVHHA